MFLVGAINKVHSVPWPHCLNRNVLTTAGIHYTISQHVSGAMEDCPTVWVQQLKTLCCQRCWMSASRCMFGSLWNASAAHVSQVWWRNATQRLMDECGHLEVDALMHW